MLSLIGFYSKILEIRPIGFSLEINFPKEKTLG